MKRYLKSANRMRYLAGILALVWMCVIFSFSSQKKEVSSGVSIGFSYQVIHSTGFLFHLNLDEEQIREIAQSIDKVVRKGAHMTEYAVLAVLLYCWIGCFQNVWWKQLLTACAMAALYACSDEIHQLFVQGRAGRVSDVLIDTAGAVLGTLIFVGIGRLRKVRDWYVSVFCGTKSDSGK